MSGGRLGPREVEAFRQKVLEDEERRRADAERQRAEAARPRGKLCWVIDYPRHPGAWPGLLSAWRRTSEGWEGEVAVIAGEIGRPEIISVWIEARYLRLASEPGNDGVVPTLGS